MADEERWTTPSGPPHPAGRPRRAPKWWEYAAFWVGLPLTVWALVTLLAR